MKSRSFQTYLILPVDLRGSSSLYQMKSPVSHASGFIALFHTNHAETIVIKVKADR